MQVQIRVGATYSRVIDVPDDLLNAAFADRRQDATMRDVGGLFVEAYREEVRHTAQTEG